MVTAILEKITDACCAHLDKKTASAQTAEEKKPAKKAEQPVKVEEKTGPAANNKIKFGKKASAAGTATKYEDVMWEKMPKKVQDAATTLGYDKDAWNEDRWVPHVSDKWWDDFSDEQKEAAKTIGWDQSAWDSKYEDKNWKDIPDHVKKAAESIGFTEEMWDGEGWPESTNKRWDDMTKDTQTAVMTLGYCKHTWD